MYSLKAVSFSMYRQDIIGIILSNGVPPSDIVRFLASQHLVMYATAT